MPFVTRKKAICEGLIYFADTHAVESLQKQFPSDGTPTPKTIADVWTRLAELSESLGKSQIMAVIYMLHLENELGDQDNAKMSDGPEGLPFSDDRLMHIKRFGKWVDCECGCGKSWSFANEVEGVTQGGFPGSVCKADQWIHLKPIQERRKYANAKGRKAYNTVRAKWLGEV